MPGRPRSRTTRSKPPRAQRREGVASVAHPLDGMRGALERVADALAQQLVVFDQQNAHVSARIPASPMCRMPPRG